MKLDKCINSLTPKQLNFFKEASKKKSDSCHYYLIKDKNGWSVKELGRVERLVKKITGFLGLGSLFYQKYRFEAFKQDFIKDYPEIQEDKCPNLSEVVNGIFGQNNFKNTIPDTTKITTQENKSTTFSPPDESKEQTSPEDIKKALTKNTLNLSSYLPLTKLKLSKSQLDSLQKKVESEQYRNTLDVAQLLRASQSDEAKQKYLQQKDHVYPITKENLQSYSTEDIAHLFKDAEVRDVFLNKLDKSCFIELIEKYPRGVLKFSEKEMLAFLNACLDRSKNKSEETQISLLLKSLILLFENEEPFCRNLCKTLSNHIRGGLTIFNVEEFQLILNHPESQMKYIPFFSESQLVQLLDETDFAKGGTNKKFENVSPYLLKKYIDKEVQRIIACENQVEELFYFINKHTVTIYAVNYSNILFEFHNKFRKEQKLLNRDHFFTTFVSSADARFCDKYNKQVLAWLKENYNKPSEYPANISMLRLNLGIEDFDALIREGLQEDLEATFKSENQLEKLMEIIKENIQFSTTIAIILEEYQKTHIKGGCPVSQPSIVLNEENKEALKILAPFYRLSLEAAIQETYKDLSTIPEWVLKLDTSLTNAILRLATTDEERLSIINKVHKDTIKEERAVAVLFKRCIDKDDQKAARHWYYGFSEITIEILQSILKPLEEAEKAKEYIKDFSVNDNLMYERELSIGTFISIALYLNDLEKKEDGRKFPPMDSEEGTIRFYQYCLSSLPKEQSALFLQDLIASKPSHKILIRLLAKSMKRSLKNQQNEVTLTEIGFKDKGSMLSKLPEDKYLLKLIQEEIKKPSDEPIIRHIIRFCKEYPEIKKTITKKMNAKDYEVEGVEYKILETLKQVIKLQEDFEAALKAEYQLEEMISLLEKYKQFKMSIIELLDDNSGKIKENCPIKEPQTLQGDAFMRLKRFYKR